MSASDLAIKILKIYSKKYNPIFNLNSADNRSILDSFKEPSNLLERSFYQYECQMKQVNFIFKFFLNIASFFLFPLYYFKFTRNDAKDINDIQNRAVIIPGTNEDINLIPNSLKREFSDLKFYNYNNLSIIDKTEKEFLKKILKSYWLHPYFVNKLMMKIALYSGAIKTYNPKAIITRCEFSFTSSALTCYCNNKGIEHYNIMHGEKLFDIRDSFVQFDRFYVWDEHYIELFKELKAKNDQFIVEMPDAVKFEVKKESNLDYKITYYLGAESKSDLLKIRMALQNTGIDYDKICIRRHPTYSNINEVKSIFNQFIIQDNEEISILQSISKTEFVASLYSTVLLQAHLNGVKIAVDDISNKTKYLQLKELNYIILKKPHLRLSEFSSAVDIK